MHEKTYSQVCNLSLWDSLFFVNCLMLTNIGRTMAYDSCNMYTHGLPNMNTLSPQVCGPQVSGVATHQGDISGKPLMPM